jgi:hypothetical protein
VTLRTPSGAQTKAVVTGDSFRSQHPLNVHFGLGNEAAQEIEIKWPGGGVTRLAGPEINRSHAVRAPKR